MRQAGFAVLLGALLVSGCGGLPWAAREEPAAAAPAQSAAREQALLRFDAWRLSGRIAVQRDDQGFSGDLDWRQRGEAFELRIAAPLNGGTFALSGAADAVTLVTPRGEVYRADSAETLMAEHLGWTIPVAGANYWVRGVPAPRPAVDYERRDAAGRWTDFAQAGWRVSILDYATDTALELPARLFLARDALKVRMVVRRWEAL